MQKVLALALTLSCSAFAQVEKAEVPFRAWPLIGQQVCSEPDIAFNTNLRALLSTDQQDVIKQALIKRAAAYRLSSRCVPGKTPVFLEVALDLGAPLNNGTRGFVVYLEAYRFDSVTGGTLTLWHTYRYGAITGDSNYLRDYLTTSVGEVLDSFAADYAKANP